MARSFVGDDGFSLSLAALVIGRPLATFKFAMVLVGLAKAFRLHQVFGSFSNKTRVSALQ